jgi:hypothetical protein
MMRKYSPGARDGRPSLRRKSPRNFPRSGGQSRPCLEFHSDGCKKDVREPRQLISIPQRFLPLPALPCAHRHKPILESKHFQVEMFRLYTRAVRCSANVEFLTALVEHNPLLAKRGERPGYEDVGNPARADGTRHTPGIRRTASR